MQEAFRQAVEKNPDSPIVPKIRRANRIQAVERVRQREEERFTQLKEEFKQVGLLWFGTEVDKPTGRFYKYDRIPIEQKRKQWMQALTSLNEKPAEQRIELLSSMASGMQLTEDNAPTQENNSKYGRRFPFTPLLYSSSSEPLGISFTRPCIFFMASISDMSDHLEEQKQEFRDFMIKDAGLKGKVGLPELFPAISR